MPFSSIDQVMYWEAVIEAPGTNEQKIELLAEACASYYEDLQAARAALTAIADDTSDPHTLEQALQFIARLQATAARAITTSGTRLV